MSSESLKGRAERILNRLTQVQVHEQDEGARDAVEQMKTSLRQRREALVELRQAESALREQGVGVPPVAEPAPGALTKAKSTLKSAADGLVGCDTSEIVTRVRAQSLNDALSTTDKITRAKSKSLNESVNTRRVQLLPSNVTAKIIRYPGASDALVARLERVQRLLTAVVELKPVEELTKHLDAIVGAVEIWERDRPLLESELEKNDPEIEAFLREAAADGAPWHLITPAVREWLANPDNTADLKVVLRT